MEWIILIVLIVSIIVFAWEYILIAFGMFLLCEAIVAVFKYAKKKNFNVFIFLRKRRERRLALAKENLLSEKNIKKVSQLGRLGQALDSINQTLSLLDVKYRERIECSSIQEYEQFRTVDYLALHLTKFWEILLELKKKKELNKERYTQYKKEFFSCRDFTPESEIKRITKRGLSVRKFVAIEKELHNKKLIAFPPNKISFNFFMVCQSAQKLIALEENRIEQLLQEILDERDQRFVRENSFTLKSLDMLNKRYLFRRVTHKKINISCNSYNEYQKFDIKKFVRCRIERELDELKKLYQAIKINATLYDEYKKQYFELVRHLRTADDIINICDINIDVERFQKIEKELYQREKLKDPALDFSVCYIIEYTSPAGRNHYEKEEHVTFEMVAVLMKEIENEQIARIEHERKMRIEAEQQRALKQEEREIQRQKRRKEQSLQRRERQLARREEDLLRREREFEHATQEHIYDTTVASHTAPTVSALSDDSALSTWERMKQLKERYESGEITYEMYDELRRNLL